MTDRARERWSQWGDEELLRLKAQGLRHREIAARLGRSVEAIEVRLWKLLGTKQGAAAADMAPPPIRFEDEPRARADRGTPRHELPQPASLPGLRSSMGFSV